MDVFYDAVEFDAVAPSANAAAAHEQERVFVNAAEVAAAPVVANGNGTASRKRKIRDEEDRGPNGLGIHMIITEEERTWAKALKEAFLQADDTQTIPVSDMEFVQYAIIERGNVAKSMDRIRKLHSFRTQYAIEDTVEHGVQCIKNFTKQQPGFLLNIDQCTRHKHFVQVVDFAKFRPGIVRLEKDWKVFMSGMYYLMSCLNPQFAAIRYGVVGIMECEGMGWDNFSMDFERRLWHEHPTVYPARFHEISWVRSPTVANVFYSLLKPVMSEEVREVCHLGVNFDDSFDGRLDALFLQPSMEIAYQRLFYTARSFLAKRYHNQTHFRL